MRAQPSAPTAQPASKEQTITEPTDAEIDALWRFEASKNWDSTLAMRTSFARAVLAKFGTPAFVGVEPYAQHAIWHVRDGDRGWDQYHDSSDPMPLGWDGDAPDEVIDLYTAAQAQAGAAPRYRLLVRGQDTIQADDEFLREDGATWLKDPSGIFVGCMYEGTIFLPARRAIDEAHGIKGGQHDV